jgi:hypothetical protein
LNLGTGSKEEAAEEAVAVTKALGSSLQSFEIGNEVDVHGVYATKFHDFNSYYTNYLAYKAAIQGVLPYAVFSGPDVAGNVPWVMDFAKTETNGVKLLTHHYYRADAKSRNATLENLLNPHAVWNAKLAKLGQISSSNGAPFRINEVNSFSGGGKAGISDTFASALWCLDFMFTVASCGGDGVNLETDINHLAWISHYSPIVHDANGHCSARPEYYGMLAFSMAGNGDLLKVNLEKGDINLSAYATKNKNGGVWVIAINKDLLQDAELEIALPENFSTANVFRLQAPSIQSTNQINFVGGKFSTNGQWISGKPEKLKAKKGKVQLLVSHTSAILLRWQ